MDLEEFRRFCLSLPEATEKMPFQAFRSARDILAFYIGGHMFCFFDIVKFELCTIKCNPEEIGELEEHYEGVTRPKNLSPRYWIGVRFNSDVPDGELRRLVRQSYEIVKAGKRRPPSPKRL